MMNNLQKEKFNLVVIKPPPNTHKFHFNWAGAEFDVNLAFKLIVLKNCTPIVANPRLPVTPVNMGYQFKTNEELFFFLDNIIKDSKKRFIIKTECLHASPGPMIGPSGTITYSCIHCKQNYSVDVLTNWRK